MIRSRKCVVASQRAFTLVELLIVMAIILLLAAVALPSVKALLHGQKVTQASRMVQAHVESARARAIASQSHVAVILERLPPPAAAPQPAIENNTTTRLSIGQVFPPYQGDITGAVGTLGDTKGLNASIGDGFFDQITVDPLYASLITSGVFDAGDFIQFGDRESLFLIEDWDASSPGVLKFYNPPFRTEGSINYPLQEAQLPSATTGNSVPFRIFRKPTKSFAQSSILPRGTCIDLSVSGIGQTGDGFFSSGLLPVMIVFNERGALMYITDGVSVPERAGGLVHLLVGRTEQVLPTARQGVKLESDPASVNANLNDTENSWISINPYSGAVYASAVQAGSETGTIATRLSIARSFATSATTRSEN